MAWKIALLLMTRKTRSLNIFVFSAHDTSTLVGTSKLSVADQRGYHLAEADVSLSFQEKVDERFDGGWTAAIIFTTCLVTRVAR